MMANCSINNASIDDSEAISSLLQAAKREEMPEE